MEIAAQPQGVREYELIYVLRPNVDNTEAERVNGRVTEIVESFGGKLTKLDNWGRRRLAYPIQKHARGLFVYAKYLGIGGVVAEVERTLRISDSVLRHQTVLLSRNVDPSLVEIDPEELKFAPVEDAEPEEEVALEQRLGLASAPPRAPRAARSEDGSDDSSDEEASAKGSDSGEGSKSSDSGEGSKSSDSGEGSKSSDSGEGAKSSDGGESSSSEDAGSEKGGEK